MAQYSYDKDLIKNELTIEQVEEIVAEMGGEPRQKGDTLICKTICHGGTSHKLYYYDNTKLFKCFTDCGETFDLFELVRKVQSRERGTDVALPFAISFVAKYFGYFLQEDDPEDVYNPEIWTPFKIYDRIKDIDVKTKEIVLKEYDISVLSHLPKPKISSWIDEGISQESMNYHNICFEPKSFGIVIPHYDINDRLVGIRERLMIADDAEKYGKYRPAIIGGQQYNHPLGYCLYNLNFAKNNIRKTKKAILFEGEKSCLKYSSIYGKENDISVACCGSALIDYQVNLLTKTGAKEIIVCYDKQYQELGDKEHQKLVRNLKNIARKYGFFVNISFAFDKGELLGYKDSPIDRGKDVFEELIEKRINLY